MPNAAEPSTFAGTSKRRWRVPMRVRSALGFKGASATVTAAAAAANWPKRNALSPCVTTEFAAWHSAAGTPHLSAAAPINRCRAFAPAANRYGKLWRTARLPPVAMR